MKALGKHLCILCAAIIASAMSTATVLAETGPRIIIAGFYHQTANAECTSRGVAVCEWAFDPIPRGKQLIATRLSCDLTAHADVYAVWFLVQRPDGSFPLRQDSLQPVKTSANHFVVGGPTLQLFASRERPVIRAFMTAESYIYGQCSIGGQIVDVEP